MSCRARLVWSQATAGLAVLAVVLGAAAPAAADTRVIVGGGTFGRSGHHHRHAPPPRRIITGPATTVFIVPRPIHAPARVVPSYGYSHWVPGYWTYHWLPQVSTAWVWVPAHYDELGNWVEARYEARLVETGAYQPAWVEGYWAR